MNNNLLLMQVRLSTNIECSYSMCLFSVCPDLFINLIYIIDEKRVSVQGGLCPGVGGLCPGGSSVKGGLCQGDPPDRDPPYGNVHAVRILLECILVFFDQSCNTFHFGCFSPFTKQIPWG